MRTLPALALATGMLALAGCPQNDANDETNFCANPWGIGPDGTQGVCGLAEMCVPSVDVTCSSNNCCHAFCSYSGCGQGVAEVSISPDDIPDVGAPGCGGDEGIIDAGECYCGDAGACFRSSCLCVCGD